MKKNILYIATAALALCFTACSEDYEDASSKHVYSEGEAPYLRTDTEATIDVEAEFPKSHNNPVTIDLDDYAETIQTKLGMTVSEMLSAVSSGSVVFYNIDSNNGVWDLTDPTMGTSGWYYNASGTIVTTDSAGFSIELDSSDATITISASDDAAAGTTTTLNVGFALVNGSDYDDYVRFRIAVSVTDASVIMFSFSLDAYDYAYYALQLDDYVETIESMMDMTYDEFLEAILDTESDVVLYMVASDGSWIEYDTDGDGEQDYTANNLGFWCDKEGNPVGWATAGGCYYVETWGCDDPDGQIGVGRYDTSTSGEVITMHFVYARKSNLNYFAEFVLSVTFE